MKHIPELAHRLKAFEAFKALRKAHPRRDVVKQISESFGVSETTVYHWWKGVDPIGNRSGKIAKKPELLYVLGALLGDGYIYHWRGNFQVGVVGELEFVTKFAHKLSICIGRHVGYYKPSSKNAWIARVGNAELYFLFEKVRHDLSTIVILANECRTSRGWLEFIEGFFDAEGCVKIIREEVRRTPKACLDICNTDLRIIRLMQSAIRNRLGIETRISSQAPAPPRRESYHLRIYRKESIRRFLGSVQTTKLTESKKPTVQAWLTKTGRESPT